jgi:hypothetical protein
MPAYTAADPLVAGATVATEDDTTKQRSRAPRQLVDRSGASALAAGVFYGANLAVPRQVRRSGHAGRHQLDDLRAANNALSVASGVSLAGAVGLGAAAVFTTRF